MRLMRIRSMLLALMIGAGMLFPTEPPAQAKTHHYKPRKIKKFKRSKKFKAHKVTYKARKTHRR